MPARRATVNRRPSAAKARALELLGQGLSERDVVAQLGREGIKVSKGSVGNWKASAPAAKTPPKAPAPGARKVSGKASAPPEVPAKPADEWELPGVDLVHLPAELLERLGKKLAAKIGETLVASLVDHDLLGALIRDHERVCKALVQARPATVQDPEKDPANLEQAAVAIGHVKRMIEDVRKRRAAAAAPAAT